LTWEWDVWGRIDWQTQAAKANVLASQEDLALARLSAQAALVQTYMALRTAERQQAVLQSAQAAYARALTLTRYRYEAGVVSAADVAQAESQWQSAMAQRIDVETTRQQLQHSLAVLLGLAPSALQLPLRRLYLHCLHCLFCYPRLCCNAALMCVRQTCG
jgi:outer membrane protein TolC